MRKEDPNQYLYALWSSSFFYCFVLGSIVGSTERNLCLYTTRVSIGNFITWYSIITSFYCFNYVHCIWATPFVVVDSIIGCLYWFTNCSILIFHSVSLFVYFCFGWLNLLVFLIMCCILYHVADYCCVLDLLIDMGLFYCGC